MRMTAFVLIVTGGVLAFRSLFEYHRLVRDTREETYALRSVDRRVDRICIAMLYLFAVGYIVGALDVLLRDVEPIFLFVAVIFFFGGVFLKTTLSLQSAMADALRAKTMEVMKTFINAIELKDAYTRGHSRHVYDIAGLFCDALDPEIRCGLNRSRLLDAALLHDIGKISLRDGILNKRGSLDESEWLEVRAHPLQGKKMLDDTCFGEISDWVLYHHERMDGRGYYGLKADEIPVESQIIAIADVYSALCTDRVYRKKYGHGEALGIMFREKGTQFNAELLECFARIDREKLERLTAGIEPPAPAA